MRTLKTPDEIMKPLFGDDFYVLTMNLVNPDLVKKAIIAAQHDALEFGIEEMRSEFYSGNHPWKPGQLENCIARLQNLLPKE